MINRNEEGVSPVIGVILMVAITVILAAVIAAFVFQMPSTLNKTHLVSVTASQVNSEDIAITYQGGPDHASLETMNITITNTADPEEIDTNSTDNPSVGFTYKSDIGTNGKDHIIVVATFTDNTQQVILDSYV